MRELKAATRAFKAPVQRVGCEPGDSDCAPPGLEVQQIVATVELKEPGLPLPDTRCDRSVVVSRGRRK